MRDHAHEIAANKSGLVSIAVVELNNRHEATGNIHVVAVNFAAHELPGVIERAGILSYQVRQQV